MTATVSNRLSAQFSLSISLWLLTRAGDTFLGRRYNSCIFSYPVSNHCAGPLFGVNRLTSSVCVKYRRYCDHAMVGPQCYFKSHRCAHVGIAWIPMLARRVVCRIKPPGVVARLTAANDSRDCRKVRLENMSFEQTRRLALPLAIAAEP